MALSLDTLQVEVLTALQSTGTTAYLVRPGAVDPADPTAAPGDPQVIPLRVVYGVWSTVDRERAYIQAQDRKVYVAAADLKGLVPRLSDRFRETADGPDFRLIAPFTTLAPTGTPLLYTLNIRG